MSLTPLVISWTLSDSKIICLCKCVKINNKHVYQWNIVCKIAAILFNLTMFITTITVLVGFSIQHFLLIFEVTHNLTVTLWFGAHCLSIYEGMAQGVDKPVYEAEIDVIVCEYICFQYYSNSKFKFKKSLLLHVQINNTHFTITEIAVAWGQFFVIQCSAVITQSIFSQKFTKPIACSLGRGIGCLMWMKHLIDIPPQFQ